MPKENKQRGRREEKKKLKRKREEGDYDTDPSKKQKPQDPAEGADFMRLDNNEIPENGMLGGGEVEGEEGVAERPFYGLLTDEEQEYFRRADELLEINNFPDPEERSLFLANVYREAEGKELKLACSQSCSRLMERLILLSTVEQKKKIFQDFSGNFAHLVQHRFASHCCETLFMQSAPVVTEELTSGNAETKDDEVFVSMENLFLYTLNELEGQMTSLLTDRFASHTLRVLLVILAGRPLETTSSRSLLKSKKKENVSITGLDTTPSEMTQSIRAVPSSFTYAIEKITLDIISTMDESTIRVLAVHPTGNPTLQLLLELELTTKSKEPKPKTLLSTLLPDDPATAGSQSQIFISGLLYDAIGSRLLETLVTHSPGKLFKSLYRSTFKDRIASLARNEIASYVVIKVLNRLSKEDLVEAVEQITPQIGGLVERNRTVVVKTILERCHVRNADTKNLTEAIAAAYGSEPQTLLLKMAGIEDLDSLSAAVLPPPSSDSETPAPVPTIPKPTPAQSHGSFLAQAMLRIPGAPQTLIQESLLTLPPSTLLTLSLYTPTSHILQASLIPTAQTQNQTFRRKLISALLTPSPRSPSPALTLADSNSGTHILDALLPSASSLLSLIERVAVALCAAETQLRDSFTGRIVWRNWSMDLFKRRRGEWVKKVQAAGPATEKVSSVDIQHGSAAVSSGKSKKVGVVEGKTKGAAVKKGEGKTAIQLARERFAASKKEKQGKGKGGGTMKGTGANTIVA
jgi:nucleolar protein 9